jgi:hypothetical protein
MGNWRTVTVVGTCPPEELSALQAACTYSWRDPDTYSNFHCLSTSEGLMGLGNWPATRIDVSGNLAERDYDVDDVARQLEKLVKAAPGLRVKVHCGGEREDQTCVATVTLDEEGVRVGPPEIPYVRGASQDEMAGRLFKGLVGKETKTR